VQRGKEINKVISILLDLHDAFRSGSAVYIYDEIKKMPESNERNNAEKYFETLIKNFITGAKSKKLERLKETLGKEIDILAQYAPITAFKLRGLEETINDVHLNSADALKSIGDLGGATDDFNNGHIIIKAARNTEKIIWNQILWLTFRFRFCSLPSLLWLQWQNRNEFQSRGKELLKDWNEIKSKQKESTKQP
jgi:hypothetical protein